MYIDHLGTFCLLEETESCFVFVVVITVEGLGTLLYFIYVVSLNCVVISTLVIKEGGGSTAKDRTAI